jgi:hypothetical protein
LLSVAAALFAFIRPTRLRIAVFALALLMHVAMALFYYTLVSASAGDAWLYYADPMGMYGEGFGFGTQFVVYITQAVKSILGGSYRDYFLLYQAFGFFGVVALMRTFEEIYESVGVAQPAYVYLLLFLPGLHYWSSAIGKDSLFFLGFSLSLWCSLQPHRRILPLAFAMFLMLAIRPHIAVLMMAALSMTLIGDRGIRPAARVFLSIGAVSGLSFAIISVWNTFRIDLTSANAISDHLSGREAVVQMEAAGSTVVDLIYPLRVLSLLFKPMFVDASGFLGLAVSFENAALIPVVATLIMKHRLVWRMMKSVPCFRYAIVSATATLLVLSLGYYNVGLGIRQKATMILPGYLVAFVALRAALLARREQTRVVSLEEGRPAIAYNLRNR